MKNSENRARVYQWFARAFSYPTVDRIEELKIIPAQIDEESAFLDALFDWAVKLSELPKDQVEPDFVTLFINGYPKTIAPPYESLFRGSTTMLGPTSDDVIQYYVKYQLEPAEDSTLPDALPIELDFVGFLLSQNPDNEDIKEFVNEHLLTWVFDFVDKIKGSDIEIYERLADLFKEFMLEEQNLYSK